MASDILLYQTDIVPIGDDQKQHLELTRDIAMRFNNLYGEVFHIPEPYISKIGARIMSLLNPERKMDKSDPNPNNYIALLDEPFVVTQKIKRAVTDSNREIKADKKKLGISNLLTIYSCLSGISIPKLEERFVGKNYNVFKKELIELVIETLRPIQNRYNKIINDKDYISTILRQGAEKACRRANKVFKLVQEKIGFITH